MTTRFYYRRGKKVEVEQLDRIVATHADRPSDLSDITFLPSSLRNVAKAPLLASQAKAFRLAGWKIVDAAPGESSTPEAAPVFRDPQGGRLLVGTRRVTVKFNADLPATEARERLADAGLTILRQLGFAKNLFQTEVEPGKDPLEVSVALQESGAVEYAEPEMIEHLPPRAGPTDPFYPRQWQWCNTGVMGGTANADVRAEEAWKSGRGGGVRVAVIDNGFDLAHPDLEPALDRATAYFQATPKGGDAVLRLDHNGFPDRSHGTFCAGIAGARADNGIGGCGAAPEAALMLIACMEDQIGTQVTLARAVAYAADPSAEPEGAGLSGADIIACSLGPEDAWALTSVLETALKGAATQGRGGNGTAIFWAVSNSRRPVAEDEVCSHPTTIAVGRSTRNDLQNDSAFGPELDFLAPGVDVYSSVSGGGYAYDTGTSFAAPCAAGVGALIVAANSNVTAELVRKILRKTCRKIGGVSYKKGRNSKYGFGRIDAASAVKVAARAKKVPSPHAAGAGVSSARP